MRIRLVKVNRHGLSSLEDGRASDAIGLREWLQKPVVVFLCAFGVAFAAVLLDGTMFRIWSLNRDHTRLEERIEALKLSLEDKSHRVEEANKPEYIERQVREQLDFVRDGDLVFVFANDTAQDAVQPVSKGSL